MEPFPKAKPGMSRSASRCVAYGWAALALTGAALLAAGCKKEAPPETVVTVQAEHPEQGAMAEHIIADAVLAAQAQAAITPKITAPVRKFYVQRGARVKAGELLAELESADLAAAALDNKGSYEAAQAAYETATKAQVPEDAQKAELDLAQAKVNLDLNESIVKARKELFAEGAIPGRDLDTAETALVQAQAAYDAAAKHAESMKAVTREAALKTAQGELTSAEGKYKGAAATAGYAEIRSPIDGFVTDRPLYAGETAAAGAPLITVMDTTVLLAKTHLAQSLVQRLKVGDDATATAPGVDEPVPAKISMISPALDPGSTTVEVWLKINNNSGALKVGTPVKVTVTGRSVANALKIPIGAVLTGQDGSKTVMVIASDGAAHSKPVTLGIQDGDDVQVLSGLSPADTVITSGSYGMDEGTKVKIGPAGDEDKGGEADDKKPDAGGKDE
ncbi:MAG TPA: efflux RND transporter periplasmic adaptor subunit [Terracidiphilus sp.]|nr:efflux RND transporter periplasmic adaptor subunit [Terracidiphilus sp.]